jgi:hypothetical protein
MKIILIFFACKGNFDIRNGKTLKYKDISYMAFEYYYTSEKFLLVAFMPSYDDSIFEIHLTSGIEKDAGEEYRFNYDALETIVDILSKRKKISY